MQLNICMAQLKSAALLKQETQVIRVGTVTDRRTITGHVAHVFCDQDPMADMHAVEILIDTLAQGERETDRRKDRQTETDRRRDTRSVSPLDFAS